MVVEEATLIRLSVKTLSVWPDEYRITGGKHGRAEFNGGAQWITFNLPQQKRFAVTGARGCRASVCAAYLATTRGEEERIHVMSLRTWLNGFLTSWQTHWIFLLFRP